MLDLLIFLPAICGMALAVLPAARWRWARRGFVAVTALCLLLAVALWSAFDPAGPVLQQRTRLPWVPSLGAAYDVALSGISLPLVLLTTLLFLLVAVFVVGERQRARAHGFLFLLMETGLLGLFAAQDLLLFYLFFEVALVPMYFIVGIWGGEERRYAAVKFFLYTRAGSLAMLLGILGLYLAMEPHSFSLPAIAAATPLAASPVAGGLVLLGLLLGFGVKLPTWPLHNWLPDAHVEAPTEGSVVLAGVQLKMGGYGVIAVLLPAVPQAAGRWGWWMVALGLVSLFWGSLAALAQRDVKRLVAFTSINHMGYVLVAAGIWALATDPAVRRLAVGGAVLQLVSHGLLTGGMFLMAGILQHRAGTRDLDRLGGLLGLAPRWSLLLALLAFASLGLPGFSGFVAELQVLAAAVGWNGWVAAAAALALVITTGLYLRLLGGLLMGRPPEGMPELTPGSTRELATVLPLAALSVAVGVAPATVVPVIESGLRLLSAAAGGG